MTKRVAGSLAGIAIVAAGGLLAFGCSANGDAPPPFTQRAAPEALFLVHNELFSIRIDGTDRRSLGLVGDNKWRTGFPRLMPDGRAIALGDNNGAIYPYFSSGGRMLRLSSDNVTLNDSVCGVRIMGEPRMVMTATPFVATHAAVDRVDVDNPSLEMMHFERKALISNPAPFGEGHVVAVRSSAEDTEIVVIDVEQPLSAAKQAQVLAHVAPPYYAGSPARLPDGRVVFVRLDARRDPDLQPGQLWMIEADGAVHATELDNIISLYVVEDYVVYETAGGNHYSEIVSSNLIDPPVNMTSTPYVSEHLGWSD